MREILFRGKRKLGNEWIEGSLHTEKFTNDEEFLCCEVCQCDVYPETVGQFTGLTDKNGTKIFEGDVVWGDDCTGTWHKGVVEYDDSICSFIINAKRFMQYPKNENHYDLLGCWSIEGNIHDNPELLEGDNE